MTERQAQLLRFIADFQAQRRFAPSFNDMMVHLGLTSRGCVHRMVQRMLAEGLLFKRSKVARSVEVTEKGLRLLGRSASAAKIEFHGLSNGELAVLMMRAKIEFESRVDARVAGAVR